VINHTAVYQDQICDIKKQTKAGYDGKKKERINAVVCVSGA